MRPDKDDVPPWVFTPARRRPTEVIFVPTLLPEDKFHKVLQTFYCARMFNVLQTVAGVGMGVNVATG